MTGTPPTDLGGLRWYVVTMTVRDPVSSLDKPGREWMIKASSVSDARDRAADDFQSRCAPMRVVHVDTVRRSS